MVNKLWCCFYFFLENKVISDRFVFCVIEKICKSFLSIRFSKLCTPPTTTTTTLLLLLLFNCSMGFVWVSNLNLNLICDYTYILTYIVIYLVSLRNSIIEIRFATTIKFTEEPHKEVRIPQLNTYMHINLTVSIIYYMIVRLIINSP